MLLLLGPVLATLTVGSSSTTDRRAVATSCFSQLPLFVERGAALGTDALQHVATVLTAARDTADAHVVTTLQDVFNHTLSGDVRALLGIALPTHSALALIHEQMAGDGSADVEKKKYGRWTREEEEQLVRLVGRQQKKPLRDPIWQKIAQEHFSSRTGKALYDRYRFLCKASSVAAESSTQEQPTSEQPSTQLLQPSETKKRKARQKKEPWTADEDETLAAAIEKHIEQAPTGARIPWAKLADDHFPTRDCTEIKNRYYSSKRTLEKKKQKSS